MSTRECGQVSSARVRIKYQGRIVVADPTQDPWLIWDLDEEDERQKTEEEKAEHEVPWRVLLLAEDLAEPVALTKHEDVTLLANEMEMPAALSTALEEAGLSEEPLNAATPEQEEFADEVARNERLIQEYLALAQKEPVLALDSHALFQRALDSRLFGSLTLYDDTRASPPYPAAGDPLPVSNTTPNWSLQSYKTPGWVARSFIHAGVTTLYEKAYPRSYPASQQGRRLILYGFTQTRTDLSQYIPGGLVDESGARAAPSPFPFVVRAAQTSA
jgi:hypothetical protein